MSNSYFMFTFLEKLFECLISSYFVEVHISTRSIHTLYFVNTFLSIVVPSTLFFVPCFCWKIRSFLKIFFSIGYESICTHIIHKYLPQFSVLWESKYWASLTHVLEHVLTCSLTKVLFFKSLNSEENQKACQTIRHVLVKLKNQSVR